MNLPLLTARIGRAWADEDIFSVLYQDPKLNTEDDKPPYIAFMTFDLGKNKIDFDDLHSYNSEAVKRYKYFGNNKAAAKQFHVVREGKDLHYFMGLWQNLRDLLELNALGALLGQLQEIYNAGLIEAKTGNLVLGRMTYFINNPDLDFQYDSQKKRLVRKTQAGKEEITMETLVKKAVQARSGDQIALVIPRIKTKDGKTIEIATHDDYLELIKRVHKLEEESSEKTAKVNKKAINKPEACYICGLKKDDLACAEYSTRLRRDGINKVFTTTTINYAKNIEAEGYEHNYSFCKDCFDDLRQGEKVVLNRLTTRLAGERTFILPEGLLKDFEYENINEIKREIDFVFKPQEAEIWINGIGAETRWLHIEHFNLNFIVYDTDGNSMTVLQTISDVNSRFFIEVIEAFKERLMTLTEHLKYFSLGSIYRVIPVKTKKVRNKTKQVDAGRVLSFYKSILKREQVKADLVYRYAVEALDKGLTQLASGEIRNYFNLELKRFTGGKEDFYIKKVVFSYLVILQAMQEIGLLNGSIFNNHKGECKVMNEDLPKDEYPEIIWEAERFLEEQNFTVEARALFYLGLMMKRVAIAQAAKGHKNKPIFKKVNFQGMNQKDILRFYEDLVEKLRQYNKINFYTEWLMNRFHHYMGSVLTTTVWPLSEHANVFYIMAGYAFRVGKKSSPDLSQEEKKTMQEEDATISAEEEENSGNSEE
ncbi:MAG: TM1802 family CRISPR-associated protein [Syntrophomonadaceae bacterium]